MCRQPHQPLVVDRKNIAVNISELHATPSSQSAIGESRPLRRVPAKVP